MKPILISLLIVLTCCAVALVGCSSSETDNVRSSQTSQDTAQKVDRAAPTQAQKAPAKLVKKETIVVNVCEQDPDNAAYYRSSGINLFNDPGASTKRKVGKIPACESITVEVLQKKTVDGAMFYKIKYGSTIGWQTRRLLTDAGNPNAH